MRKTLLSKFWLLLLCTIVGVNSAWADEITIWSEDFTGLAANATPTSPTNTSYTGVTYTCTNGAGTSPGTTKVMAENLAGSDAPELMVGKKGSGKGAAGGKFTVVIPLDNIEGTLTLTYYQNKQSLKVSSTTSGVSGGQTLKPDDAGKQTTTFTGITTSMTSITLVFEATTTSNVRLDDIVLKGNKAVSVATPTFSVVAGSYTSTQSVELSCSTTGATIYYTLDGSTPTSSSDVYSSAISVNETKTIKAIAIKGSDASNVASATYSIYPVLNAGTEAEPYTVADARNAIDANIGVTGKYATGIVSEIVTAYNGSKITFNISTDGLTTSDQLQAYNCISSTSANASDVKVGDIVVVKGTLKKYNSTYEFAQDCEVTSISHPTTPLITVASTSLTGFTYGEGSGPSDVKTFSVEGSNLTADISLSLGESSNFEMSTNEGSGYSNTIYLTPTTGTVAETTIYVRLKAGLTINTYNGTITLSSTDATDKTIILSGSVVTPNFTWDLSTDQTTTASETEMTWIGTYASMAIAQGTSTTKANNYYPGTSGQNYTSTRFYKNSVLTITPATGYKINSIEFEATTAGYASALQSSTWTNASATASKTTVTVTPSSQPSVISASIGATCGFTGVKVYYTTVAPVSATLNAFGYATLASNKALDFSDDSEYSAWQITSVTSSSITFSQITGTVAAGTGILLKGTPSANIDIPVAATGSDISGTNKLEGIITDTDITANAYYGLSGNKFVKVNAGTVPAGKALLPASLISAGSRELMFIFEDETTGITTLKTFFNDNKAMYNLKGQRIDAPRKGEIYIMGGKKMVKK